jgi:hypothetical protein
MPSAVNELAEFGSILSSPAGSRSTQNKIISCSSKYETLLELECTFSLDEQDYFSSTTTTRKTPSVVF